MLGLLHIYQIENNLFRSEILIQIFSLLFVECLKALSLDLYFSLYTYMTLRTALSYAAFIYLLMIQIFSSPTKTSEYWKIMLTAP